MTISSKAERSFLQQDELTLIDRTHYPAMLDVKDEELSQLRSRIRALQSKDRDLARQMKRAIRGKAESRGSSFPGNVEKPLQRKQALAGAARRVNSEITRRRKLSAKDEMVNAANMALAMKAGADKPPRPHPSDTPDSGLNPIESRRRRWSVVRAKVGSISQRTRNAQARKDNRPAS